MRPSDVRSSTAARLPPTGRESWLFHYQKFGDVLRSLESAGIREARIVAEVIGPDSGESDSATPGVLDSDANLAAYLVFDYERPSPGSDEGSVHDNPFEKLREEEALRPSRSAKTQTVGKNSPGESEKREHPSMTTLEQTEKGSAVEAGQGARLRFSHATKSILEVTEKAGSIGSGVNTLALSVATDESHFLKLIRS